MQRWSLVCGHPRRLGIGVWHQFHVLFKVVSNKQYVGRAATGSQLVTSAAETLAVSLFVSGPSATVSQVVAEYYVVEDHPICVPRGRVPEIETSPLAKGIMMLRGRDSFSKTMTMG
mmetsp:Transcript_24167/g.55314  ORF Transcript_24167/g.55314 Transcript_24167/m.55314 type:complete len:116 (+) Transcript_24167:36-383(+)